MNLYPSRSCRLLLVAALAVTILAASIRAEDRVLKVGKPEQVGMSARRLEIVNQILTEETKSRRVTAASVLVARRGLIVLRGGWGTLAPDADSPKAGPETVYILASITKPVTVTAVMMLVERGELGLEDHVAAIVPKFAANDKKDVRIHHLMNHTSGLPDMPPNNDKLRAGHKPFSAFIDEVCGLPLAFPPGTKVSYQSMGRPCSPRSCTR